MTIHQKPLAWIFLNHRTYFIGNLLSRLLFDAIHFVWILCAFFASGIEEDNKHNPVAWSLAGLVWGPLGLLAAVGLGDRRQILILSLIAETQGVETEELGQFYSQIESMGEQEKNLIAKKRGYGSDQAEQLSRLFALTKIFRRLCFTRRDLFQGLRAGPDYGDARADHPRGFGADGAVHL